MASSYEIRTPLPTRIAAAHAHKAAGMLRAAAASPDPRLRGTQIEEALVRIRAAGQYLWGPSAEQCDRIVSALETDRGEAADLGLYGYAGALEDLCADRVRALT